MRLKRAIVLALWFSALWGCATARKPVGTGASVPSDFAYPRGFQRRILDEATAKNLAGRVTATRGDRINGKVLVEIIDNEMNEKRLDARFTDEAGRFDFGDRRRETKIWLKLSMPGFDTVFVPVRVSRNATADELIIEIPLST